MNIFLKNTTFRCRKNKSQSSVKDMCSKLEIKFYNPLKKFINQPHNYVEECFFNVEMYQVIILKLDEFYEMVAREKLYAAFSV